MMKNGSSVTATLYSAVSGTPEPGRRVYSFSNVPRKYLRKYSTYMCIHVLYTPIGLNIFSFVLMTIADLLTEGIKTVCVHTWNYGGNNKSKKTLFIFKFFKVAAFHKKYFLSQLFDSHLSCS